MYLILVIRKTGKRGECVCMCECIFKACSVRSYKNAIFSNTRFQTQPPTVPNILDYTTSSSSKQRH